MPDCSTYNVSCLEEDDLQRLLSSDRQFDRQNTGLYGQVSDPMDVILDTCWAVMTEVAQLDEQCSPHLKEFYNKYSILIEGLAKIRNASDKYEIVEKVGKGAYGNVYLIREASTGHLYAMKTIAKSEIFRQPENACFMEERVIMSCRDSKWLATLKEAFQDELFLYLIMEYFPGGDLNSLDPEQKGTPEEHVKFYAAEIVLALEELHGLGFAHRDVKPGNVMLREDGHVKLTDFGSAGRINPSTGLIFSKTSVGTPDYISPEALLAQQSRNGAHYGPECDWWALGVLMWEMLVGEPPFFAPSLVQTYQNISKHASFLKFDDLRISEEAKSLLRGLLCDSKERLGLEDIKKHPFFANINWDSMHLQFPPFVPILESPIDTSRFYLDEEGEQEVKPAALKSRKNVFEGIQLPFAGFTFDANRSWRVIHGSLPKLQRIESSQLRLNEVEAQVEELRQSCETARLVADQIKRVASTDSLSAVHETSNTDNLQAAYDALVQNYEFLQMHYGTLLTEHNNTSHQLQALISAFQEQDEVGRALEADLSQQQHKASLDKLKIEQLVKKLASVSLVEATPSSSLGKERQLLKQRTQECKRLEQQLQKEVQARERLGEEMANLKGSKAALEREHEALLAEYKSGNRHERRPSDASTMLRSVFSLGRHHSRQPSTMDSSTLGFFEGTVRILDTTSRKRGKLTWIKVQLILRDSALWAGEALVASLKSDVFWAQPVQPGELVGESSKITGHCFKIRSIATAVLSDDKKEESVDAEEAKLRLEKEKRILHGATQLLDAAKTLEQQTIARAHVEASIRTIANLEAFLNGDRQSVSFGCHCFACIPSDAELRCDACFKPGATHKCPDCDTLVHRECQSILQVGCSSAAALRDVLPVYIQAGSSEETRRWLRVLDNARQQWHS